LRLRSLPSQDLAAGSRLLIPSISIPKWAAPMLGPSSHDENLVEIFAHLVGQCLGDAHACGI
jgi:hypothetical protein